ncbi:MBL fold metallo-hydrolase [Halobium salinum]|uniref:MBL fold metallo-hydrolase n=1 Tax=Halobium salinum TaxID=1364940 RepID=A0ABD5PEE8_9EURY|nr:MBL fold metallo-hydrolase [Halobium salinum]
MIRNVAADVRGFTSNAFLVSGVARSAPNATGDAGTEGPTAEADAGATGRTVLVDAGAGFDVVSAVREAGVDDLDAVLLTHTHPDHVGNVDDLREAFGVETWGFDPDGPAVDNGIADGETLRIGTSEFTALHTPGHKDDHLCFLSADGAVLFAGDLVFADGGFGRTDLPEGNRGLLVESLDRVVEATGEGLEELHTGHGRSVVDGPFDHVELAAQAARADY